MLTIGKPIGGGIPTGAYGISAEVAERIIEHTFWEEADVGGVGGTLAGNALSLAAVRATLAEVLTAEAFERMIALGERFEPAVAETIAERGLPWSITRLGCRAEYMFSPTPGRVPAPRRRRRSTTSSTPCCTSTCSTAAILLTPFHMMALMSPATTEAHVDRHTDAFARGGRRAHRWLNRWSRGSPPPPRSSSTSRSTPSR